jgi:hypothetical protein
MQPPGSLDPTSTFVSDIVKGGVVLTGMFLILWAGLKARWLYPREKAAAEAAAALLLKATCESYEARLELLSMSCQTQIKNLEESFGRERILLNARLADAQASAAEWKLQTQSATSVAKQAVTALPVVAALPGKPE